MTDSEVRTETWASCLPPFSSYEASDGQPGGRAQIRSVDRVLAGGRRCNGQLIAQQKPGKYWQVTVRDDSGRRRTIEVHALVVPAHERVPCPPGMQVRHFDDDPDNNAWAPGGEASCGPGLPGNLVYGTPKQNRGDRMRNSPAAPTPPPRLCEPHGRPVTRGSRSRCHECVVQMGQDGAELLRLGYSRADAAAELEYPSPDGLWNLAVRYGGYVEPPPPQPRLSQRVRVTVRNWLRFGRDDTA